MLNDITTDLADPPRFFLQDDPPADFDPATVTEHAQRHETLGSICLNVDAATAYARALAVARGKGWNIVASDAARGQIEAVATTAFLRFKDDIVIRLSPDNGEIRVDMRSKSRKGKSDFGVNAKRIQDFLDTLDAD